MAGPTALDFVAVNSGDSLSDSHQTSALTLREILKTPSFHGTEVIAGASGLDRVVASVNVMENPDIIPWVKQGELLITVGYALQGSDTDLATLVERLDDREVAAFGIKLGPYLADIDDDVRDTARRRGFPILALPGSVSFDDLIADVYGARDSLLLGGIERRRDREQELMNVALEGGGPAEVAARLAGLAACEVVVLGQGNEVVAHFLADDPVAPGDLPALVGRFDEALNAPIVFGSTYVGQLYVFPSSDPQVTVSPGLVPVSAKIMALAASREIAVASVDRQFRAEFLERVLLDRLDRSEVDRRCQALDWRVAFPASVVILSPVGLDAAPLLERTLAMLDWSLRARGLHAPHAVVNGDVVAIVAGRPGAAPEELATAAAREVIARSSPGSWAAGVSAPVADPTGFRIAWDQAAIAARVTRKVHGVGDVGRFSDLGIYRLLSDVDPDALRGFAREVLGDLYEPYGVAAELRRTLAVLLDSNMNVAAAARELHYHYNSIRYRVAQLEELLGPFVSNPTRRLELHVALLISDMTSEPPPHAVGEVAQSERGSEGATRRTALSLREDD